MGMIRAQPLYVVKPLQTQSLWMNSTKCVNQSDFRLIYNTRNYPSN